jgi:hypothetical protein
MAANRFSSEKKDIGTSVPEFSVFKKTEGFHCMEAHPPQNKNPSPVSSIL